MLVLCSTSRYRRDLLKRLDLPFDYAAPDYDEEPLDLDPVDLAVAHATNKAKSLAGMRPDSLLLGSDQLLSFEGDILGKPKTVEAAEAQLARLSGKVHRLITGVALYHPASKRLETAVDVHEMRMRTLSAQAIRNYVAHDYPLDCAGSYKLESQGIALFESISGGDDTAVVGLPLLKVVELLGRFEIDPLLRA
jgi:septum formation protein